MKDLRIFIDMDGTCVDWMTDGLAALDIDPNDPRYRDIIRTEHDAPDIIAGKERVNKTIADLGSDFWTNLKLLPWGKRLVKTMKTFGEVHFLTSPGTWVTAGQGKAIALKRDFDVNSFILLKEKHMVAMPNAILIDDKPSNITKFRGRGGWAYLWPNQYKIFDNEPHIDDAIEDCVRYVRFVKDTLAKRNGDDVLFGLSQGNIVNG